MNKTDKDFKNDDIMNQIIEIYYNHNKRYGYRRITLELANRGYKVNHKKVKRLMSVMSLYGTTPKAKYKSYKGNMNKTVKNKLLTQIIDVEHHLTYYERDFNTTRCSEKWSSDVSEFHIAVCKLYLSPIIDMHNREIVSYNISERPNFEQIKDMINKAFYKYSDLKGLIIQSD